MMRLKSELWVRAYLRRSAVADAPAFVVHHGDDTGGAIYIKVNHLDGTASLFGPAPIGFDDTDSDRLFAAVIPADKNAPESEADNYMRQQLEFDSDLWLIELEDAKKRHFLEGWLKAS